MRDSFVLLVSVAPCLAATLAYGRYAPVHVQEGQILLLLLLAGMEQEASKHINYLQRTIHSCPVYY